MTCSLSRRRFIRQAALTSVALHYPRIFAQQQPTSAPIVQTDSGPLRGLTTETGVRVFKGVPFAQPPIGALRFRPPVKPVPWTDARDATVFSASPMQTGEPAVRHSEDCLYLNLWAPPGKGPFPVFVWIHGGGFTGGHAFEPIYDGSQFAREGVVCITIAYRLGVFGFLDLEALLGEQYAGSANNALRDIIAALEWVQQNVADFGGDPSRVTISGESAGAKLSDILMGIPSAQPLFHQMISESGGAERIWSRNNAMAIGKGFAETWKTSSGLEPAALLTAPAENIIPIQKQFIDTWPAHFPLRAEIDGTLIQQLPIATIAAGSTRGKRLLIGSNRDESALFVGPHPSHDATAKDVGNLTVPIFTEVYSQYKTVYPEMTDEQRRIRALTAEEYWVPSIRVADAHLQSGGTAWMYELAFAETSGRLSGYAFHSLDVGLVWDKPHVAIANASEEATVADRMHAAWVAFIHGDTPAAPGLPVWPAYNPKTRPTMILDVDSHIQQLPQDQELQLWAHVL